MNKCKSIFRVPIKEVKYIIDERRTKCIIYWINPISGGIQKSIGITYCNPNDEFNPIIGKRLSESRAKYFLYRSYVKAIAIAKEYISKKYLALAMKETTHELKILNSLDND